MGCGRVSRGRRCCCRSCRAKLRIIQTGSEFFQRSCGRVAAGGAAQRLELLAQLCELAQGVAVGVAVRGVLVRAHALAGEFNARLGDAEPQLVCAGRGVGSKGVAGEQAA